MLPKKRRFIQNAMLLTVISFVLRTIGTVFMIYISNRIGSEGIGLYQLTASVYMLAITLATSGITVAVVRIVSEQFALKNMRAVRTAFRQCFFISILLGLIAGGILLLNADSIGNLVLKDSRTILSLKYLAIGLPFLSTAAVIRGYFLGISKPMKAAGSDVVEQLAMMLVTVPILTVLLPKGLEYACLGLVLGSSFSEIISCAYAILLYLKDKVNLSTEDAQAAGGNNKPVKGIIKQIFSITAPIAISNYVRSTLTSLENILIPTGLKKYGASGGEALSQYGMIKGMAMPILFFPSAILSAFSSLLVPEVSGANAVNAKGKINFIVNKCFKVTLLFSFLITGIFLCFSPEIGDFLYHSKQVGTLLFILSPLIPLMYLDQIVDSILKGLNQQVSAMKYNTADSIIRVLIIYLLVPIMGLKGYIIMLYVGTIFNASLSINRLIVVSRVKFHLYEWVVLPVVAITLSCLFTRLFFTCPVLLCILAVCVIYLLLLLLFRCITKRDISWAIGVFKGGKKSGVR